LPYNLAGVAICFTAAVKGGCFSPMMDCCASIPPSWTAA